MNRHANVYKIILLSFIVVFLITSMIIVNVKSNYNLKPVKVTAHELYEAYEKNEENANELYLNKTVIVSGNIGDIGKDVFNNTYVTLYNEKKYSTLGVKCFFTDIKEIEKVETLNKDDYITIIGTVRNKQVNVKVKQCTIK